MGTGTLAGRSQAVLDEVQRGSSIRLAEEQPQAGQSDLQFAGELVQGEALSLGHGVGLDKQGLDFAGVALDGVAGEQPEVAELVSR
jgi:hypothetical protein